MSKNNLRIYLIGTIIALDVLAIGLGANLLIIIRFITYIILCVILFPYRKYSNSNFSNIILTFSIYILILSLLNSNNIFYSFETGLKTILSLIIGLIAFHTVTSKQQLIKVSKFCFIALILVLVIILLSNMFGFGEVNYHDSSILFGASGVNISKNLSLYAIGSLIYIKFSKYKFIKTLFISLGIFLVVLSTKRGAMLTLVVSLLTFASLYRFDSKKILLPALILLLPIIYFASDLISSRFENRAERFDFTNEEVVETEWRYIETQIAIEQFRNGSISDKLFGNETFNEVQSLNLRYMFHNDFAVLIAGMGIIGIIIYIYMIFVIYKSKKYIDDKYFKFIYLSILFSVLTFSLSGNFKFLGGTLSTQLILIGSILGFYKRKIR